MGLPAGRSAKDTVAVVHEHEDAEIDEGVVHELPNEVVVAA